MLHSCWFFVLCFLYLLKEFFFFFLSIFQIIQVTNFVANHWNRISIFLFYFCYFISKWNFFLLREFLCVFFKDNFCLFSSISLLIILKVFLIIFKYSTIYTLIFWFFCLLISFKVFFFIQSLLLSRLSLFMVSKKNT